MSTSNQKMPTQCTNGERPLPGGWVWTTIGAIAETTSGGTPSRKVSEYFDGSIPWVKSGELGDSIITSTEENITEDGLKHSSAKVFPKGTPLVALYGATVGKTAILQIDASSNQAVCAMFAKQDAFTPKYLIYWLRSQRDELIARSSGGAQPNISQTIIRAFPFPLPPLPEQQRIVAAIETQFTRLDAGVAALKRVQANLKRYKASVLKAACKGRLMTTEAALARAEGRDYEPAEALLDRILAERRKRWEEQEWRKLVEKAQKKTAQARRKAAGRPARISDLDPSEWQDLPEAAYARYLPKNDAWKAKYKQPPAPDAGDLSELPEGWVYSYLEPFLSLDRTGMKTGPFGSLLKKHEHRSIGIQVFGIENIDSMLFAPGNKIFVTKEKAEQLSAYDVLPGDLLISRSGTVGEICVVPPGLGEARLSTNLMRIVLNQTFLLPQYFTFLFNGSPFVVDQVSELCSGSTRDFLNQKILATIIFPIPPLTEQHRIVAEVERRLSLAAGLEATVEASLKRAERLRQAILKHAFEGKLAPQDPHDEPAGVLLERIQERKNTG